jgi:hypothetical protein
MRSLIASIVLSVVIQSGALCADKRSDWIREVEEGIKPRKLA